MSICLNCNGRGKEVIQLPACGQSPMCQERVVPCSTCNGSGSIMDCVKDEPQPVSRGTKGFPPLSKPTRTRGLEKIDKAAKAVATAIDLTGVLDDGKDQASTSSQE